MSVGRGIFRCTGVGRFRPSDAHAGRVDERFGDAGERSRGVQGRASPHRREREPDRPRREPDRFRESGPGAGAAGSALLHRRKMAGMELAKAEIDAAQGLY